MKQFYQCVWDEAVAADCHKLAQWAIEEDLHAQPDWTSISIVPEDATATAKMVSRESGVFVGAEVASLIAKTSAADFEIETLLTDGSGIKPGDVALILRGEARHILSLERTILNFAGRLSGIATLTRQYVDAVAHTQATICDTRKTTPGWRRLEKYAVHCGGGSNHRMGLYDAILIKDNHLAFAYGDHQDWKQVMKQAVKHAKETIHQWHADEMIIEIEVDTVEQFQFVIGESPDIVLLDNMTIDQLKQAVKIRDRENPDVLLEASGGVNLQSVAAIAETGVERISVGALTHSATNFDLGLDWS